MSPIIATTFCPEASPLPAGAASTVPAASIPGTRGKLTPSLTPSRSFSSERLRPNASTRMRTQPSRSGGSGSAASRRLSTGPGAESRTARMVASEGAAEWVTGGKHATAAASFPTWPAGLTLTLRQPSMLAGMSIPPVTSRVQGPVIQVQGLQKSYKELRVLRGVDFEVARGGIFALLGSNGAGKTTVVKILATLLRANAGTASVNGFDVGTQPANVRESISLTGQFAAVDEILSGRENLVLVARLRHLKDPGVIADDLLRRFSLTDAGSRRVSTYSGGMRRRLDIAMSLIGHPPVIFLDEPTTGLDPQARLEVWQAVRKLAAGGTTVLLTTQYLDEAEQLADRIAILHQGRIIVHGTLADLKRLLPPAKVEYVEKQPSLEDVFFAVVGN